MKKVLVIVVTHNGMRWLERCLSSVALADVYVLDNDSTDGSADYVQAHFPQVHLVRSADNLGFTGGNNLGFQYALERGYDYVYLLNQDAWLEEGALEKLLSAAEAQPDYAVLSPLQLQADGSTFDRQFAKLFGSAEGVCSQTSGHPRPDTPSAEPVEVNRIMAAHWLMPLRAVKEIGLFSELFPYYGQDDDWCHRAHFHGKKVGVLPSARAVHDRARREESVEKIIFRNYYTGSLVRLCDINHPLWDRFCYVLLFTLVKAVKYRKMLVFKYFRDICRQLSAVREHRRHVC